MNDELERFTGYLQRVWMTLAGVSALFPLSNVFLRTIPVARWTEGGFGYFPPALVSSIATLACLFTIYWLFSHRKQISVSRPANTTDNGAIQSFVFGILLLLVYLAGHYAVRNDFYFRVLAWESGDLKWIIGDLLLLAAYTGFFVCVTRAFVVLALREFMAATDR